MAASVSWCHGKPHTGSRVFFFSPSRRYLNNKTQSLHGNLPLNSDSTSHLCVFFIALHFCGGEREIGGGGWGATVLSWISWRKPERKDLFLFAPTAANEVICFGCCSGKQLFSVNITMNVLTHQGSICLTLNKTIHTPIHWRNHMWMKRGSWTSDLAPVDKAAPSNSKYC